MSAPDYRRIHELEYDLGFTDEKPPGGPQTVALAFSILKELYAPCTGQLYAPSTPSPNTGTPGSTPS